MPTGRRDTTTRGNIERKGTIEMTIAVYAASVALATACVVLLFVAIRRLLGRQEEIVATMLRRYDERLAEFAQTLNDAVNRPHPPPALSRRGGSSRDSRARRDAAARARQGADVGRRGRGCRVGAEQGADARDRRAVAGRGRPGRAHGRSRLPGCEGAPGRLQRRGRHAAREHADSFGPRRAAARRRGRAGNARSAHART